MHLSNLFCLNVPLRSVRSRHRVREINDFANMVSAQSTTTLTHNFRKYQITVFATFFRFLLFPSKIFPCVHVVIDYVDTGTHVFSRIFAKILAKTKNFVKPFHMGSKKIGRKSRDTVPLDDFRL